MEKKKIILIVSIIALVGVISLAIKNTFAFYENNNEISILSSSVGDFSKSKTMDEYVSAFGGGY